jgi:hypothetical protein
MTCSICGGPQGVIQKTLGGLFLGFACRGNCASTLWETEVLGKSSPLEQMFARHSQACIAGQADFEPCVCRPPAFVGAV